MNTWIYTYIFISGVNDLCSPAKFVLLLALLLAGPIPPELGNLAALEELILSENQLLRGEQSSTRRFIS